MNITMMVYPGMTPLDLMGPLQAWSLWPGTNIQIVWKDTNPVMTDTGMALVPTHSFADAFDAPDILFVPGGATPTIALMEDEEVLEFLRQRGSKAAWKTSVCTGALLLGAAGLLTGFRATTHWVAHAMLESFGAIPVKSRWVIDGDRATGGGVTAGIDFGLALIAEIDGEDVAKTVQLAMEYDPQPPFLAGTPEQAGAELTEQVIKGFSGDVAV